MSVEVLSPITAEMRQLVRKEFGMTDGNIKEAVQLLKTWLSQQPHLPEENDDFRLEYWLLRCKNSAERTKKTLDMYYTLKAAVPELLAGWDTNSDWFKVQSKIGFSLVLPDLTAECDRVAILGLQTSDPTNYNFLDIIRMTFMTFEVRMLEDYYRSEIIILDLNNYTMEHATKFRLTDIKKLEVCAMHGYRGRPKAVHLLNVPPYADVLITMVKTILKNKIVQRIHVHRKGDYTSLYNSVPKEILPKDYGGTCGTIAEHWSRWIKKLESCQHLLSEREQAKAVESKRPNKVVNAEDLFGFDGSFRKLDLD